MVKNLHGQGIVVVGAQWGDEGKGRIVDIIASNCDVVARFQGGNNAGHSLHFGEHSLVLHLIPCGIVRPDKICVIGNGVVIDPLILAEEIKLLKSHGIEVRPQNLKISNRAHIIFPYHKSLDIGRESIAASHIGTTK
jgi:adenylosuccinate synthase